MDDIKIMERRILKMSAFIAAVLAMVSFFIDRHLFLGILAGFFIGVFYFKILVFSIVRIMSNYHNGNLKVKNVLGGVFRFLLLGLFFWMASLKGLTFFIGSAVGFFSLKVSIIYLGIRKGSLCRT
jgi:hypothetical protein